MIRNSQRLSIYLAGGFKSKWQADAAAGLLAFRIFDPSEHEILDPVEYTKWDLAAIRECDIVLANMEATNPGGYALALEIGYAHALNKYIVLVDGIAGSPKDKYFDMVRQCSNCIYGELNAAVAHVNEKFNHPPTYRQNTCSAASTESISSFFQNKKQHD